MAAKKPAAKAASTAVAPRKTTAVSTITERLRDAGTRQREQIEKMPGGEGNALSFQGGSINFRGKPLGNAIEAIILATQFERVFYPAEFDANNKVPPSCYSRDNIRPDEQAAFPQSDTCKGCQWDEFGTATQGKGKGCKEGLKIAVVHPAQAMADNPPIVVARFSPMNAKDIQSDLTGLAAKAPDHPMQAIVKLTCHPDPKRQIRNALEYVDQTPDDMIEHLVDFIGTAEAMLVGDYPADQAVDPQANAKRGAARRRF